MLFRALACDYDGTLAHDGLVEEAVVAQLSRLKVSGRHLILVTGRQLEDLLQVFPGYAIFDRIVAENGGVLFNPATREERILSLPPPGRFVEQLKADGVEPVSAGKVIVATWSPYEGRVLETIHALGLEMQVVFNKGAVMVLPSGVNKATGLESALNELSLSRHNTIAVGDAENDHAMFSFCECSVAVANALPMVREHADFVTSADHGRGVCQLVGMLLENEIAVMRRATARHQVCIGTTKEHQPVGFDIDCRRILICGPSGSGKTLLALAMIEQIAALQYQFCLVDPECDFNELSGAVVLGDSKRAPTLSEISQALSDPAINVVVSLLGIPHDDRPSFFLGMVPIIRQLRNVYGRPHWFVADEAHYLLPAQSPLESQLEDPLPLRHSLLITVHPEHLHKSVLQSADIVIATACESQETLHSFCRAIGEQQPQISAWQPESHQYLFWDRANGKPAIGFDAIRPRQEHHRHVRKYSEGDLGAYHSFYFTGPEHRFNLKAQNLQVFTQIASGIDDDTWLYHLRRHDYSRWFRGSIRDEKLANEAMKIENDFGLSAQATKQQIAALVYSRYCAPA